MALTNNLLDPLLQVRTMKTPQFVGAPPQGLSMEQIESEMTRFPELNQETAVSNLLTRLQNQQRQAKILKTDLTTQEAPKSVLGAPAQAATTQVRQPTGAQAQGVPTTGVQPFGSPGTAIDGTRVAALQNLLQGPDISFTGPGGTQVQQGQITSFPDTSFVTRQGIDALVALEEQFKPKFEELDLLSEQEKAAQRVAFAKRGVLTGASATEEEARDLKQEQIRRRDALNQQLTLASRGVSGNIAQQQGRVFNDLLEQARQRITAGEETFKGQNELLLRFLEQQQQAEQARLTPDIKEFAFAQSGGFQGDFLDFQKAMKGQSTNNQITEIVGEDGLPHKFLVDLGTGERIDLGVSSVGDIQKLNYKQITETINTPEGPKLFRFTFDDAGNLVSKVELGSDVVEAESKTTFVDDIVNDAGQTLKVLFDRVTGEPIKVLGVAQRDGGDLETTVIEISRGDGKHKVLINKKTGEEIKDLGLAEGIQTIVNPDGSISVVDENNLLVEAVLDDPQIYNTLGASDRAKLIPTLKSRGFDIPISAANEKKVREALQSFGTADGLLKEIESLASKVITAQSAIEVPGQVLSQKFGEFTRTNPDIAVYKETVNAFKSLLVRGLGQVGVLTDRDIRLIEQALPQLTDTVEIARGKLDSLNRIYEAKKTSAIDNLTKPMDELLGEALDKPTTPTSNETENIVNDFIRQFPDATQTEIQGLRDELKKKDKLGTISTTDTGKIQIPDSARLAKVNNNPGNLRFARQTGAEPGEGGFARFPSPEAGFKAVENQIKLDASRGLTLGQFINKYAPPVENDTSLYLRQMEDATGADRSDAVSDIDTRKLAKAIVLKESSTRIT